MKRRFLCVLALAGSTLCAEELSAPIYPREIPIIAPAPQPGGNGAGHFEFTIEPLSYQRIFTYGMESETAEQRFGLAYRLPVFEHVTLGYSTGGDFTRQNNGIFNDLTETAPVTMWWTDKVSLAVELPWHLTVTDYAQLSRGASDSQAGFSDAVKYGGELAWMPQKDVTKISAQASRQETRAFDNTILLEDIYGLTLEQKLPFVPVTLQTATALSNDQTELLPDRDKTGAKFDAALLWKIRPQASWSCGLQSQDSTFSLSGIEEASNAYFTEVKLQPVEPMSMNLRVSREVKDRSRDGEILNNDNAVVLSLGTNWKFTNTIGAGFGVSYRVPDKPASAVAPVNQTTISVSANGQF